MLTSYHQRSEPSNRFHRNRRRARIARGAAQLQAKFADGEYDDVTEEGELALRLTMDLRSISGDHHWSVAYDPEGSANQVDPEKEAVGIGASCSS